MVYSWDFQKVVMSEYLMVADLDIRMVQLLVVLMAVWKDTTMADWKECSMAALWDNLMVAL